MQSSTNTDICMHTCVFTLKILDCVEQSSEKNRKKNTDSNVHAAESRADPDSSVPSECNTISKLHVWSLLQAARTADESLKKTAFFFFIFTVKFMSRAVYFQGQGNTQRANTSHEGAQADMHAPGRFLSWVAAPCVAQNDA